MSFFSGEHVETLELWAPSRLHFGLLPDGYPTTSRRGGVGVMIENPHLNIIASRGVNWKITGPLSDRIQQTVALLWDQTSRSAIPLRIHVKSAPPSHAGFGSGTQLSLAILTILRHFQQNDADDDLQAPDRLGRGSRSKVGSIGFRRGGLIYDPGHSDDKHGSSDDQFMHFDMPRAWRWLTVTCREDQGLAGEAEKNAFSKILPEPARRVQLTRLIETELLRGIADNDIERFGAALTEYGNLSGTAFAPYQHGLYRSAAVADIANRLKGVGVHGVGQSSWGPTIFGLFPNQNNLEEFIATNSWLKDRQLVYRMSPTNSTGVRLRDPERLEN